MLDCIVIMDYAYACLETLSLLNVSLHLQIGISNQNGEVLIMRNTQIVMGHYTFLELRPIDPFWSASEKLDIVLTFSLFPSGHFKDGRHLNG